MTRETETDRELWRRAAAAQRSGRAKSRAPDPLLVAGYLDGSLADDEREAFEARLAVEPELLETVISARAAFQEGPEAAPARVVRRAQAIVGRPGRAETPRGGGFPGDALGRWLQPLGWAAVCALALIATGAGFEIGREGYGALVEYQTLVTDTVAFDFDGPGSDPIL